MRRKRSLARTGWGKSLSIHQETRTQKFTHGGEGEWGHQTSTMLSPNRIVEESYLWRPTISRLSIWNHNGMYAGLCLMAYITEKLKNYFKWTNLGSGDKLGHPEVHAVGLNSKLAIERLVIKRILWEKRKKILTWTFTSWWLRRGTRNGTTPESITIWICSFPPSVKYDRAQTVSTRIYKKYKQKKAIPGAVTEK